ncbi:MAG: ANTAR domain-containing protein [Blautia sp.]|nr:ANTAR domain-containing protein [Blautia sp.]
MPREEDRHNSILIVSGSERFDMLVRKTLSRQRFTTIDFRKNASSGRRLFWEKAYDLIVINCPLPDEFGHEFALDAADKSSASVLLVVPGEIYEDVLEHVTDRGIMVLSKPAMENRIDKAIRLMIATQARIHIYEKKVQTISDKMEELRVVSKAKLLLIEQRHMTEDEAHRLIGRQAMDNGVSRRRIAEQILDEFEA